MRVFFLSEKTCALTIGGAYLGLVDGFERYVELEPSESLFCELKPCGNFLSVRFTLDDDFLLSPPPQVRLYYTENGLGIYVCDFLRADGSMHILWQKRLGGTLMTLAVQGKLQLWLSGNTAQILDLPDALETCDAEEISDGFLLKSEAAFALISREGKLLVLSEGRVMSEGDCLKAEVPFHDSMGHTAVCEWKKGELVSCSIKTAFEPLEATFALALFESALIGADFEPFLAENLVPKAGALKEFLGDYHSVVLTSERDKVGLVYARRERVFDVRYFRIETENKKICNIRPI